MNCKLAVRFTIQKGLSCQGKNGLLDISLQTQTVWSWQQILDTLNWNTPENIPAPLLNTQYCSELKKLNYTDELNQQGHESNEDWLSRVQRAKLQIPTEPWRSSHKYNPNKNYWPVIYGKYTIVFKTKHK
jgi:hypothetical protein